MKKKKIKVKYYPYKGKTHINPGQSIIRTVFAIIFSMSFSLMWIGICIRSSYITIVCAILVGLCFVSAIFKLILVCKGFANAKQKGWQL